MRGRGNSFHGPVNSGEAEGHRSKPEVVLASLYNVYKINIKIKSFKGLVARSISCQGMVGVGTQVYIPVCSVC